jgi:hypothetical protein
MKPISILAGAALVLALSACSSPQPGQYANGQPVLDIQSYFNGRLDAHGMFQDRSGTVVKRFVAVMHCSWSGDTGILDEDFSYSDGTKQRRVWTIRKTGKDSFSATAGDVVGTADGLAQGNALRWKYVLALPVDGKIVEVDMEDWMFLIDGKVMLNRTTMSKFGFNLGSVTLSFAKRDPA